MLNYVVNHALQVAMLSAMITVLSAYLMILMPFTVVPSYTVSSSSLDIASD